MNERKGELNFGVLLNHWIQRTAEIANNCSAWRSELIQTQNVRGRTEQLFRSQQTKNLIDTLKLWGMISAAAHITRWYTSGIIDRNQNNCFLLASCPQWYRRHSPLPDFNVSVLTALSFIWFLRVTLVFLSRVHVFADSPSGGQVAGVEVRKMPVCAFHFLLFHPPLPLLPPAQISTVFLPNFPQPFIRHSSPSLQTSFLCVIFQSAAFPLRAAELSFPVCFLSKWVLREKGGKRRTRGTERWKGSWREHLRPNKEQALIIYSALEPRANQNTPLPLKRGCHVRADGTVIL